MTDAIDEMSVIDRMNSEGAEMTGIQEKMIMQKQFIRKYGVRSSTLDCVIEVLKKEEKYKNEKRKD